MNIKDLPTISNLLVQGLSFHFRKSDQPEGLSFYDMVTTGKRAITVLPC